ncbi:MAG: hypothetical protein AB8F74_22790 [Saprospiraceae bacterium]
MKKIYLSLVVAVFLLPFLSAGQAPGYLGKKAIISFSTSAIPTFNGPTQNNRGREPYFVGNGTYGVNYEFEGNFEYVVGRYRSVALSVSQYYTGAKLTAETRAREAGPFNDFGFDRHELFLRLNVKSVGLVFSRYKKDKGGLAPVGNRFYWGLKRSFISSKIVDKNTNYHNDEFGPLTGHEDLEIGNNFTQNYLFFGWSNNQVFWDKLVFKTGFRLALPLNLRAYSDSESDSSFSNEEKHRINVANRLALHEAVRFDIGLGLLLF